MELGKDEILQRIPHRDPFLWVDSIVDFDHEDIFTVKEIPSTLELFKGHYPDRPILPGVILCESAFQSGALLISKMIDDQQQLSTAVPVVARIINARFKRQVFPGDTLNIHVSLKEKIASAWFLKGVIRSKGKVVLQIEFSCTLVPVETQAEYPPDAPPHSF